MSDQQAARRPHQKRCKWGYWKNDATGNCDVIPLDVIKQFFNVPCTHKYQVRYANTGRCRIYCPKPGKWDSKNKVCVQGPARPRGRPAHSKNKSPRRRKCLVGETYDRSDKKCRPYKRRGRKPFYPYQQRLIDIKKQILHDGGIVPEYLFNVPPVTHRGIPVTGVIIPQARRISAPR